ncbi:MAG: 2'-5' RNA ligase family protein [Chloroflexota bacterium]|nr:2'-5' RNA ligase family protein [Chloroflexota bacterium]
MPKICINLTFDPATEQAIQTYWSHILDTGITELGLTGYRPHITLAVYNVEDIAVYETHLVPVASAFTPFPVLLESLGLFPEQGVIFLAPRMSHTLFSLHRATLQAFTSMNETNAPSLVGDWLLPDRWTPHATLARQLTATQVLQGLAACLHHWVPIHGQATGIGMRLFPESTDYRYYPF